MRLEQNGVIIALFLIGFKTKRLLGYRTESGRKITRAGVQPKQILQWHYSYYYVYGLVDPLKGRSFFYEFSHFNSDCLGTFLA